MDKALTENFPKLLFVAAVRSVSTTASDTIDINSRASLTVRLSQLQEERYQKIFLRWCCCNATSK